MTQKLLLRDDLQEKFCECCGRPNKEIWAELVAGKKDERDGKIYDKSGQHFRFPQSKSLIGKNNYFYSKSLTLRNCEGCGEELDDEDVRSVYESRGEFWGAPCSECVLTGYTCSNCGYEAEF